MAKVYSKLTVSLAAAIALLGASNAYAVGAPEVTEASTQTANATPVTKQPSAAAGIVLAGNQRVTNLQKTPVAIIVAGIAERR